MSIKRRHLIWVLAWSGAAYGLLRFGNLPGDLGHTLFGDALCGPWGWMPPLQALAALHGLWILAITPVVAWAIRDLSATRLRQLGGALIALGVITLATLALREATRALPAGAGDGGRYFLARLLFVLATLTDVPVVPVIMAGTACTIAARMRVIGQRGAVYSEGARSAPEGPIKLAPSEERPGEERNQESHEQCR